jgi:RNA polymerase sigma-70 factor (ECF subfamily)
MAKSASLKDLGIQFKETKSEKTFTTLYYRLKPGLQNYIYQIVKDYDVANHILSLTMTDTYNKIDKYDPKWHISTWIYRIAYTHSVFHLRKKKSQKTVSLSTFENDENRNKISKIEFDSIENYKDILIQQEEESAEKFQNERLKKIVDALPLEYKEVVIEKFFNDLKYDEISQKLNIPLHTVKNRISRGKRIIKEELLK